MLTRLRNANSAHHETVTMPHSKLKSNIAEILQAQGYISGWTVEDAKVGKTLTLTLKYGPSRERALTGVRRVSKPGLRVYAKSTNLPPGPRRPRRGDPVHVLRPADGPSGPGQGRGRRSPRLRLVIRKGDIAMSRIGKLPPVPVPAGVDVTISGALVTIKGPKGPWSTRCPPPITVAQDDGSLVVSRPDDERESRALHGLTRTLLANIVTGVTQGYEKKLEIVGTGYRVAAKGRAWSSLSASRTRSP